MIGIRVELDQRSLARAQARLAKWEGRALAVRIDKAVRAGVGLAVSPMRPGVPSLTGKTRRSVSVRKRRPPAPYIVQYGVKPRTPQTHLLNAGHRIVTHLGNDTGQRSTAYGFIEATIRAHEGEIIRFIDRNIKAEGISVLGASIGELA